MFRRFALSLFAIELFVFFAAASAPSPLLVAFGEQMHFGAGMLTLIFAIYALTLLIALLIAGSLSDHLGRRPVIIGSIAAQLVALALLLFASDVAMLLLGRAIQGIATGAAMGALTAAIVESAKPGSRVGVLLSGSAPLAGLGFGGLVSGVVARYSAEPQVLIFATLMVLFVVLGTLTFFVQEPGTRKPGAIHSLTPRATIAHSARSEFARTLPLTIAVWATGGMYLSIVQGALGTVFHVDSPLAGGLAIALLNIVGAAAPIVLGRVLPRPMLITGGSFLAAGATVLLVATLLELFPLFLIGTTITGVGFGASFAAVLRVLTPLAAPDRRAELFAALYVVSYLAFSLPALAAGVVAGIIGFAPTLDGYLLAIGILGLFGALIHTTRPAARDVAALSEQNGESDSTRR